MSYNKTHSHRRVAVTGDAFSLTLHPEFYFRKLNFQHHSSSLQFHFLCALQDGEELRQGKYILGIINGQMHAKISKCTHCLVSVHLNTAGFVLSERKQFVNGK